MVDGRALIRRWRGAIVALIALGVTLALAVISLWIGGFDASDAFGALFRGSLGSPDVFFSVTLVRSVPLMLTGLAVALAFRAGVWNIGAEGQLYAGAVAATFIGLRFAALPAVLLIPGLVLGSAIAGMLWSAVPALMKRRLGVGEVITTILMNFVAIEMVSWLLHGPMMESRGVFPQSDRLGPSTALPILIPGTRLHLGFAFAVVLAIVLWLIMRHTRVGFSVRAVGASPGAARAAGRLSVGGLTLGAFLVSGAIAGTAGGIQVAGVTRALYDNLSAEWGYTAIAVALLAGLHPLGVIGTAILFGALEGGAAAMQRSVGVPFAWVNGIKALVILSVLLADRVLKEASHD